MALTYFLIPTLFGRQLILPTLAKWQPYVFSLGMAILALFMMAAGTLGVPRRHWDIAFSGSALPFEYPGTAYLMMGIVGVGAMIAVVGGASYILITVGSILFGKRVAEVEAKPAPAAPAPGAATTLTSYGAAGFAAPGTFALALVFLVSFVAYYFVNWKYLASVWGLS
jgi:cytochrome c oxidase subunit 1